MRIWTLLFGVFSIFILFVPLFNTFGYEFSLAISLFFSLGWGHIAAGFPGYIRSLEQHPLFLPLDPARKVWNFFKQLLGGLILTLFIPLFFVILNGLRVKTCDYISGFLFFFLMPLIGCVFTIAWGLFLGFVFIKRRFLASLGIFLVYFMCIGIALYRFYTTPVVYSFSPLFGYFPGVLYEEVIRVEVSFLTYRLGTLFQVGSIIIFCILFLDRGRLRLYLRRSFERRVLILGCFFFIGWGFIYIYGSRLGHRCSSEELRKVLGAKVRTKHFDIFFSAGSGMTKREIELLKRDHEFCYYQLSRFFRTEVRGRISSYVFESSFQRKRFIGIAYTSLAKPWRREIYILQAGFPHPVLKHELAHIFAGTFASPPFYLSAKKGIFIRPGLIEGAAVAASPRQERLTPHEWAKTMLDIGILPRLHRILDFNFLGEPPSKAYTVAGSFVKFLITKYGISKFKESYRTGELQAVYRKSLKELEKEWILFLKEIKISSQDKMFSRELFSGPSIFKKVCPRRLAYLRELCTLNEGLGRFKEAIRIRREILDYESYSFQSLLEFAYTLQKAGKREESLRVLDKIFKKFSVDHPLFKEALTAMGDLWWMKGDTARARALFEYLLSFPLFEHERRAIEVKIWALKDSIAEPYLKCFFFGRQNISKPEPLQILTLKELISAKGILPINRAIGYYLLGRKLFFLKDYERALFYFIRSAEIGKLGGVLERELLRLMGISYFHIGDYLGAIKVFNDLLLADISSGRQKEIEDWIERSIWEFKRVGGTGLEPVTPGL